MKISILLLLSFLAFCLFGVDLWFHYKLLLILACTNTCFAVKVLKVGVRAGRDRPFATLHILGCACPPVSFCRAALLWPLWSAYVSLHTFRYRNIRFILKTQIWEILFMALRLFSKFSLTSFFFRLVFTIDSDGSEGKPKTEL